MHGFKDTLRGVLKQVVVHPCMVDNPALSQGAVDRAWMDGGMDGVREGGRDDVVVLVTMCSRLYSN